MAFFSEFCSQKSRGTLPLCWLALPLVKLRHAQSERFQQVLGRQPGLLGPVPNEIHDRVADIRFDPASVQSSPSSFFNEMCSAINSARTSSFCRILDSSFSMRC